jgi:hypothetical protein
VRVTDDDIELDMTVLRLRELYRDETTFQLAGRLKRRARLVRPLEPRRAMQLEERAAELARTGR